VHQFYKNNTNRKNKAAIYYHHLSKQNDLWFVFIFILKNFKTNKSHRRNALSDKKNKKKTSIKSNQIKTIREKLKQNSPFVSTTRFLLSSIIQDKTTIIKVNLFV
jgi:hypothetical protein